MAHRSDVKSTVAACCLVVAGLLGLWIEAKPLTPRPKPMIINNSADIPPNRSIVEMGYAPLNTPLVGP